MQLSTAYKQRLVKAARIATASAMVVSSVGAAVASPTFAVGSIISDSTTISDSAPSTTNVTYTVSFQPPSTDLTTAINRVDVKVCTAAGAYGDSCTAPGGFDIGVATGDTAAGFAGSAGATAGTFTKDGANTAHFVVTTPATETAIAHNLVFNAVTNPSGAGSYYLRLQTASDSAGNTPIDNGENAFAIVAKVSVSGRVLENLTFTVGAVSSATQCGTSGDTATVTSTATTIPFGNFNSGTPVVACQTVNTGTNALNGYTTTIHETNGGASPQGGMCRQTATNCTSDGGAAGVSASDVITDTGLTATPATWTNGTTFGLGLNANGGQADSQYGGVKNYRTMFGATAINVATNASSTNGVNTNVVFRADVPAAQVAGVYQNSFEYTATPKF